MKVAIGTDDGKTIQDGPFELSRYYQIIEMLNGQIAGKELRKNPYWKSEKIEELCGQAKHLIGLLKDCALFMARSMGKKIIAESSAHNIDCIITTFETIESAFSNYLFGNNDRYWFYDECSGTFISCGQREKKVGLNKG